MKILCYGDSNTWGYDPRGPFGSRYLQPWPELLAKLLSCTVINRGENGREIPKHPAVISPDADLLIVMLGTNDLLQFWSPEAACDKMEAFLRNIDAAPESILLIAPPTMKLGEWVQDEELIEDCGSLARCYAALADRMGIRFADAGKWDIPMSHDGVHMTEDGHHIFAKHLSDEIKRSVYHA